VQLQQDLARCIVDEYQQRAWLGTVVEPTVLAANDLHKFAIAFAPKKWLIKGASAVGSAEKAPLLRSTCCLYRKLA
jgi:hypothetical protein